MAKKRKASVRKPVSDVARRDADRTYQLDETFDNSEDDFRTENDRILLDNTPAAKRQRRLENQEREVNGSEDEIYRDNHTSSSGSDNEEEAADEDEREAGDYWGSSKEDYYNADVIETEADALAEEEEAKRLMLKQLKGVSEADYGFNELEWHDNISRSAAVEKLPELELSKETTPEEKTKLLRTRYPEFQPLLRDFVDLHKTFDQLSASTRKNVDSVALLQFRALSTYLATIAVYLALLTQPTTGLALSPAILRTHEIMSRLFRSRQIWEGCKNLSPDRIQEPSQPKVAVKKTAPEKNIKTAVTKVKEMKKGTEKEKKKKQSQNISHVSPEPINPTNDQLEDRKTQRKVGRGGLEALLSSALAKGSVDDDSAFGDENPLTGEEAAEKARKKKSLRFYTSQISQKANRRGEASRNAGGDDDVPHKERLRDRQDRLVREAQQKALKNDDAKLTDDHSGEDERDAPSDDEYYDMLLSRSKDKKANKAAKAEAESKGQVYIEDEVGDDGKRKITYAIQKNKGLAPRRKKEVRNPRVKKRNMFEKKMKKLAVIRPQYKGGEGRGGYGGELTGIKTNVVKSIKL